MEDTKPNELLKTLQTAQDLLSTLASDHDPSAGAGAAEVAYFHVSRRRGTSDRWAFEDGRSIDASANSEAAS